MMENKEEKQTAPERYLECYSKYHLRRKSPECVSDLFVHEVFHKWYKDNIKEITNKNMKSKFAKDCCHAFAFSISGSKDKETVKNSGWMRSFYESLVETTSKYMEFHKKMLKNT